MGFKAPQLQFDLPFPSQNFNFLWSNNPRSLTVNHNLCTHRATINENFRPVWGQLNRYALQSAFSIDLHGI